MAITIKLNAKAGSTAGVDFNSYYTSYFADLTPSGWPYILGGASTFEGDQIVLLDEIEAKPANTKAIVLDGEDFFYHFNGHDLSGRLTTVRLATLGASYNSANQSFTIKNGHIANISTAVEISGLAISNAEGVENGAFHNVVAALMGSVDHGTGTSDPTLLSNYIWAQAHNVIGSVGADSYTGTSFGDTVSGNGGNDTLNGGGGADILKGGAGNDVFFVDLAGDRVVELAKQGIDLVHALVSHTLAANVEKLILTGSANTTGTGNAQANAITGNSGNNTLNGSAGADTLTGGRGHDVFIVDSAADRVVELAAQGFDQVRASVNYVLGANIEQLVLSGAGDLGGIGNALNNTLNGNSGDNSLNGNAGNDTVSGGLGADTIYGGGGAGADRLSGGLGANVFQFLKIADTSVATSGRDLIADFKAEDRIQLSAIDANSRIAGNQGFHFIDTAAFSEAAGELRFSSNATGTYVSGDVNGDATADFTIRLLGSIALTADDFIL